MKDLCTPDNCNVGFNITIDGLKDSLNEITVSKKIPDNIRRMIEFAQKIYLYSYYEYDFYALTFIYLSLLTETAIRERLLIELPNEVKLNRKGETKVVRKNYRNIYDNLWEGWKIKEYPNINKSLKSIIKWIKNESFLPVRYKILDIDRLRDLRNSAAHLQDKDIYTPAMAQLLYCRTVDLVNCLFDPIAHANEPTIFKQVREYYQEVYKAMEKRSR